MFALPIFVSAKVNNRMSIKTLRSIGIASVASGLFLVGASFYPMPPSNSLLARIVGGLMLVEAVSTFWMASKKQANRTLENNLVPDREPKQDWTWVAWCTLAIAAVFGLHYYSMVDDHERRDKDWSQACTSYQHKDYEKAEASFQTYIDETNDKYGEGHYYLGLCLKNEGKTREARDAFLDALQRSGPKGNYWSALSQTRHQNCQRELKKLVATDSQR